MRNEIVETIKHPFGDKPFIPLAILYKSKPKHNLKYREAIKMICVKNHKKLLHFGIKKGQVVNVEPNLYNLIEFYDTENKINRYIKLPPRLMKKFKEA